MIDVPDLDAALEWAGKAPSVAWGAVEVRPGAVYYQRRRLAAERVTGPAAPDAGAAAERAARTSYGRLVALLAGPERRPGARRGRARRGLRAGPDVVARERRAAQPGGLAAHRRAQPAARRLEVAGPPAHPPLDDLAEGLEVIRGRARRPRRARSRRPARPASRAAVRLRPPGHRPGRADPAHAPDRARLRGRAASRRRSRCPSRPWRSASCGPSGASATPGSPSRCPPRAALAERLPPVLEAVYGCHVLERGDLAGEAQLPGRDARDPRSATSRRPGGSPRSSRCRAPGPRHAPAGATCRSTSRTHGPGRAPLDRGGGGVPAARERRGPPGRFQLEAAIQAVHCDRATDGHDRLGGPAHAVPRARAPGALAGCPGRPRRRRRAGSTDPTPGSTSSRPSRRRQGRFQPWWATRAHLLAGAGRVGEAAAAFTRAAELADDDAVRAYLLARQARVLGVRWGPETAGGE